MADAQKPDAKVLKPWQFQPGHLKLGGRKKGDQNKAPAILKEALLIAAELEGSDGNGYGKLVGFLRRVAREDIGVFCSMLGRCIPLQEDAQPDIRVDVVYRSVEEVCREMESRGIDLEAIQRLMLPYPDEVEGKVVEMTNGQSADT